MIEELAIVGRAMKSSVPQQDDAMIRVAARVAGVTTLGPGHRYAMWVQGCPFSCPGCIAPSFLPSSGGQLLPIALVRDEILASPDLSGITLSGGEPFAQAAPLARLLDEVLSARAHMTTIVYTGYRHAQLLHRATTDRATQHLLSRIDVLIDGLYRHDLNDSIGLRGSSNQEVHMLTDRVGIGRVAFEIAGRFTQEIESLEGTTMIVGVPSLDQWRQTFLE